MKRTKQLFGIASCAISIAALGACAACDRANAPQPVASQNASANANNAVTNAPSGNMPASGQTSSSSGDAIDTTRLDAEIASATAQAERNPSDEAARSAVARAYVQRGNALTNARQYRAALGDYRRALGYDPDNTEAQQGASLITGIMQSMGREIPTEGNEPPPLPMTPDTIPSDIGDNRNAASNPTNSNNSNRTTNSNRRPRP